MVLNEIDEPLISLVLVDAEKYELHKKEEIEDLIREIFVVSSR